MQKQWITKISSALLIVMLVAAALPVTAARAATITVNILTDENTNNLNCSLREAIIAANTDAAYRGCSAGAGSDTITLTSGSTYALTLIGAGDPGDLDITSNITIQASGVTLATIDPDTTVFNERVLDVHATGNLTLNFIRVTSAFTASDGAGLRNVTGGIVSINDSRFDNNSTDLEGGAIRNNGGIVSISNSTFDNNTATSDNDGGAIQQFSGSMTITGSTFTSNAATDDGGAIYNSIGGAISVTSSTFENNTAVAALSANSAAEGGAIRNTGAMTVQLSSFINNSARVESDNFARGGAISNIGTGFIVANSTFSGNSVNKTVAGINSAQGGALFTIDITTTTVDNVTFSGNAATTTGGASGGGSIHRAGGIMTIANSILAGGTENGAAGNCGGTITNGGNNIDYLGGDCGFAITTNPNLGSLTGSPQYFPLNAGSPAIDTGNNVVCASPATNNESQNGVTRPVGTACDIGSYETPANTAPTGGNGAVTTNEDALYTFTVADFTTLTTPAYADAEGNPFAGIQVTSLETAGTLQCGGVDVPLNGTCADVTTLTFLPALNANGNPYATFGFKVYDGTAYSASSYAMTVNVTAVNDAPSFTKGADQTVNEDAGAQTVPGWATAISAGPVNESAQTLTFNVTGNTNAGLFSAGPAINGTIGNLTYTPAANTNGSATITITLSDNGSAVPPNVNTSASQTFVINVTAVNDPPSFTSVPVTGATQGTLYTYDITTADPDGDPLTLIASTVPAWLTFTPTGGGTATLSGTPANSDIGSHIVVLRVSDGIIPVPVEQAFTIVVANANDVPTFTSTPVTSAGESILYTYTIVTTDLDTGDTLTISATTLPSWLTLVDNGNRTAVLSGTPSASQVGVHSVVLEVTDGTATSSQIFDITVWNSAPRIATNGINTVPDTGDGVLDESERVVVGVIKLLVTFNQDVYNPTGNTDPDDVTNPVNYLLVRDNGDGFQTTSCLAGVSVLDTAITVNSIAYSNGGGSGPFVATVSINDGLPLSNGNYRLYICGTTSIVDIVDNTLALAGNGINPGTDFIRNFTVAMAGNGDGDGDSGDDDDATSGFVIPFTGFAPHQITVLPVQPANKAYKPVDQMRIEIPTLGINFPIVGAALNKNGWDLTWLQNSVGYLEGSAYPTHSGNTVLTAHVLDANNNPGPFSDIKGMQLGQKIYIHAFGQTYVYQVQENRKILPASISKVFKHEEYDWITLVTCENYNAKVGLYTTRRMVRAVLISVIPEK